MKSVHEFPMYVSIMGQTDKQVYCGGTILDSLHVLTATHCNVGAGSLVRYGSILRELSVVYKYPSSLKIFCDNLDRRPYCKG